MLFVIMLWRKRLDKSKDTKKRIKEKSLWYFKLLCFYLKVRHQEKLYFPSSCQPFKPKLTAFCTQRNEKNGLTLAEHVFRKNSLNLDIFNKQIYEITQDFNPKNVLTFTTLLWTVSVTLLSVQTFQTTLFFPIGQSVANQKWDHCSWQVTWTNVSLLMVKATLGTARRLSLKSKSFLLSQVHAI